MLPDTIAAIATPLGGEGGIGVVRISGPDSLKIIRSIFKPSSSPKASAPLAQKEPLVSHKLYHGWILDRSREIDQVVVSYMANPRSYTGEDVIEISCHGGGTVLKHVLELVVRAGARLAVRGEFTKRAFLNGKLDLAQAEAVIDLIKAKTREGSLLAASQMKGSLSSRIREIRGDLMGLLAEIEASIDFPDEVPDIDTKKAGKTLKSAINTINKLIDTAELGKIYREGVSIAIVGKPNVGKSSLLNALIREERAIVTDEPGTTRDIVEETLNIKGIPARVLDTAGIRHSRSKTEKLGIDRALKAIDAADMVLLLVDISQALTREDLDLIARTKDNKRMIVLNKADLPHRLKPKEVSLKAAGAQTVEVSALNGSGVGKLERAIFDTVGSNKVVAENPEVMVNLRQKESLIRAKECLQRCLGSAEKRMQADFVSIDLKAAIAALGEVTGEIVSEEVIDRIFEEFCVGK
ncbi:MAG: tRNA uridine-5-carboxymethylaminomethyl(34) synthesis GTPase MnmE [bacterium]